MFFFFLLNIYRQDSIRGQLFDKIKLYVQYNDFKKRYFSSIYVLTLRFFFSSGIFKVDLKIVWQEYKKIGRILDLTPKKKSPLFEG